MKLVSVKNVLIGRLATIICYSHGHFELNELRQHLFVRDLVSKGKIIIKENVWIIDKDSIYSNGRIGRGAIIASNSVVTKDVPAYSMAGGCPAKIIKVSTDLTF
jgi:acetyltransferase-like isoleucine patch superfamily enzyme